MMPVAAQMEKLYQQTEKK